MLNAYLVTLAVVTVYQGSLTRALPTVQLGPEVQLLHRGDNTDNNDFSDFFTKTSRLNGPDHQRDHGPEHQHEPGEGPNDDQFARLSGLVPDTHQRSRSKQRARTNQAHKDDASVENDFDLSGLFGKPSKPDKPPVKETPGGKGDEPPSECSGDNCDKPDTACPGGKCKKKHRRHHKKKKSFPPWLFLPFMFSGSQQEEYTSGGYGSYGTGSGGSYGGGGAYGSQQQHGQTAMSSDQDPMSIMVLFILFIVLFSGGTGGIGLV
ncbi:hypothetical protein HDE_11074 [Halotydeus destructor]|nr:hypothetical protein HDE_11074 [Halotydeus destructor]